MTPRLIFLFGSMLGIAAPELGAAGRLKARIVDDATGNPVAARIVVTTPEGGSVEIDGRHPHVQSMNKRWCYVDGAFAVAIPDSGLAIEFHRGLETLPLTASVSSDRGRAVVRTFRLHRWSPLRQQGYVSGDIHAHGPVPAEARLEARAEDLGTLTLLHLADPETPPPISRCFTGRLDAASTPDCAIDVGQEIQDWQMGHISLLGLPRLVPGYPYAGGSLEYWRSRPQWDLVRAMRAARADKGLVVWSHFCSLPGAESPIAIALGLVDAIELVTWNDPTQLPNHWGPWLNSGMSQAEFSVMRPVDLYYQFLNAGFRLPIAAGTDKFGEEIPLGSNRVYARTDGSVDYDAWLAAVKAGRSFVTNGPMLEFTADGRDPGDVVSLEGTRTIKVRAVARSILPFTTLEIVMNGRTVVHRTVAVPANPAIDGIYSMTVEGEVELAASAWLAARVVEHPDLRNPILPRGLSVFAHTSPVHFLKGGRPVRDAASVAYLRKWVEATQHWLASKPAFANAEDVESANRAAAEAHRLFETEM